MLYSNFTTAAAGFLILLSIYQPAFRTITFLIRRPVLCAHRDSQCFVAPPSYHIIRNFVTSAMDVLVYNLSTQHSRNCFTRYLNQKISSFLRESLGLLVAAAVLPLRESMRHHSGETATSVYQVSGMILLL